MVLHVEYAYMTHPGKYRKTNQDNLVCLGTYLPRIHDRTEEPVTGCTDTERNALFGVFDGMGGEEHGEMAALIAARKAASMDIRDPEGFAFLCEEANREICRYVRTAGIHSSGTTASMLLLDREGALICHIGDSRIYSCGGGIPEQLTRDDVWPAGPGGRHMLLQCLGIPEEEMRIRPHLDYCRIRAGTTYLICTDGLTNMLPDDRIAAVLSGGGELKDKVRTLTEQALEAGGRDNITLFLIDVKPC